MEMQPGLPGIKDNDFLRKFVVLSAAPGLVAHQQKHRKGNTNEGFEHSGSDPGTPGSASRPPLQRSISRRLSSFRAPTWIKEDESRRKQVLKILVVLILPIAALIALTLSQLIQAAQIRQDALDAEDAVDNFLRIQQLIIEIQQERAHSNGYLFTNGVDAANQALLTGKRQTIDIALSKFDSWPVSERSPTYMRTAGNLKLHLDQFRPLVDNLQVEVLEVTDFFADVLTWLLRAVVADVKLPEKGHLWRNVQAAAELVSATDPTMIQVTAATMAIPECTATNATFRWYHTLRGDSDAHRDNAFLYNLGSKQKYMERVVDTGMEEKLAQVAEEATSSDFVNQHCQFSPPPARFGIFWNWFLELREYVGFLRDVSEELLVETRAELEEIVDDAEREFLIYLVGLVVVVILCLIIAIWKVYSLYKMIGRIIHFAELSERTSQSVASEQRRNNLLLCQILPPALVDNVKRGKDVSVEYFDAVTISYLDIVGFVAMIADYSPVQVVTILNNLYRMFDETIEFYNIQKIEQNNDVYCVASGLPNVTNKHTMNICDFLLEIMDKISRFSIGEMPDVAVQVRAGAHTGPCAAGIVGHTIPRYSVFGETVKLASRMSRTGEVMKIQISDQMKSSLQARCGIMYSLKMRGEVEIFGYGKMTTYFLQSRTTLTNRSSMVL